ncbi:uncharacterized protein LOC116433434 [Nomia melanderi]|uniref:uncharacterized protein LOC116433434 n=1 Tax=Nomia melanderi TaxID=2448451 RepID=UPI003FCCF35D
MRLSSEEETVRFRPSRMKLPTDEDFSYAMDALRIVTWSVGTWPLQTYTFWSGLRFAIAILLLMLVVLIINVEIFLDFGNTEKTLNGLLILICAVLGALKVASFRLYPTGLIANFVSAVEDYRQLNEEEKRAIVRRHAYMGRMSSASVILFSYFSVSLYTLAPMLTGSDAAQGANSTLGKRLDYPIPSEYTLQLLRAPGNLFAVIYFVEYFLLLVTAVGNLGSDSLFFGIIFHLCGQVELLKLDFSRFLEDDENRTDRFVALIKRHHHLLTLAEYLNDTIHWIMVIQLFGSCMLICTSEFQFILSLNVSNVVMVVKTFMVMFTLLGQMFAYSLVGEYSKNQFEGIGQLAYCSSWYNAPPNLTRDIMFLLMKTQYPVHLRAGRFFVINMETYSSILRTSMSYLSVLRLMVNASFEQCWQRAADAGSSRDYGCIKHKQKLADASSRAQTPLEGNATIVVGGNRSASSLEDEAPDGRGFLVRDGRSEDHLEAGRHVAPSDVQLLVRPAVRHRHRAYISFLVQWSLEFKLSNIEPHLPSPRMTRRSAESSAQMLMMLVIHVEIYLDNGNAEKTLEALLITACGILGVLKVASFRLYPRGLIANFVSAVEDYRQLNGEEKRAIVRHHAYMGRILSGSMIFVSYLSATLFIVVPMFAGDDAAQGANATRGELLDYPFPSECTLQLLGTPEYLRAIIYFGEYFMLLVTVNGNIGSDLLFIGIIFHLCGQVEVLKVDFSNFLDDDSDGTDRFTALIKRHHHLLTLAEYLNDTIGLIMVIQLFTSCLLICVSGFQFILSLSVNNVVMVVKSFMVMTTLLGQMFAYSYVGEYSKNQFESIGHYVCRSNWYNAPPKLSKHIMFLLMKTQCPVHLKAGRFFVINIETYTSILKSSMSYLSVLRVMVTT